MSPRKIMSVIKLNKHLQNNRDKMFQGRRCPNVILRIIKKNQLTEINTESLFGKKKIILFSIPGAFTSVYSKNQLLDFEKNYDKFLSLGINEIFCISVNDGHVMNAWAENHKLKNVKVLPDGNSDFTRSIGMLVDKNNIGFGTRSLRYSAIINDCVIEKWWQETGMNSEDSNVEPYDQTTPENCIKYLSSFN